MAGKPGRLLWVGFFVGAVACWAEDEGPGEGKTDPPVKPALDSMVRAESAGNFDLGSFSFAPGKDEERVLLRLRPSLAATPSEDLSARVEGQWYAFYDDRDFSSFSLYQGYVEGILPGMKGVSLKAGRQEFAYGSAFLLGADAFYDGLSFDAARFTMRPSGKFSVDLLGGQYAPAWSGGIKGRLYGIYATYAPGETFSVDLYGFRDTGDAGGTHVGGDHEITDSVGARLSGKVAKRLSYELEPVIQYGRKKRDGGHHDDIRASGGHADLTWNVPFGRRPGRLFLGYAYGSGDGNADDGQFREFHNPNNDTPLIGDMNAIGDLSGLTLADPDGNDVRASGLKVLTYGGAVDLTERFNLSLDAHHVQAHRAPDGISRTVGLESNLILTWRIREDASAILSVNRFFTGDFFQDATKRDKDIHYVYAQLQAVF